MPAVRIVFTTPDGTQPRLYFQRMGDPIVTKAGTLFTPPRVTAELRQAGTLDLDTAKGWVERWRLQYIDNRIFIEDLGGNVLHGGSSSSSEDLRQPLWIPDQADDSDSGFPPELLKGYLVRPARRPQGPCWCIRAVDTPSMSEHLAFESVYGDSPEEVVARAKQAWGKLLQPSYHPDRREVNASVMKEMLKDVKQSQIPGRLRPGDISR